MKKNAAILTGLVLVVIVLAGGYALFHKSSKKTPPLNSTTSSASQNQTAAINSTVLTTKTSSSVGQYLASSSGMALYTYGGDSNGVSNVTGALLASWPAYIDSGSTANLPAGVGTIKRTDNG